MNPTTFQNYLQTMALAGLLAISFTGNSQMVSPQPGYQHFVVGKSEVTAVSDGTVPVKATELLYAKEPTTVNALIHEAYLTDPVEVSINAYLIRNGDRLILVDAGAGSLFGPLHGGKLVGNI
jgi:hypothetical protein